MTSELEHETVDHAMQPEDSTELRALYKGFEEQHLIPLWTQRADLMPTHPKPKAVPHVWKWANLLPLAEKSGELIPVGRGGERRAIGLANPGLGGNAYVSPTMWAAIQYLGPRETAPEHRHSQNAFRFVVDGEGVWTVVNGDPVRMSRGDLLLTPGWNFHGHHNDTDHPMTWIDGLDRTKSPTMRHRTFRAANGCGLIRGCGPYQACKTPLVRPSAPIAGNSPTAR
jgi:gentisate 1,2-dioxygenase